MPKDDSGNIRMVDPGIDQPYACIVDCYYGVAATTSNIPNKSVGEFVAKIWPIDAYGTRV